jgi:hypothetical protein
MVNPLFLLATNLMPYILFDIYIGIRYESSSRFTTTINHFFSSQPADRGPVSAMNSRLRLWEPS